MEKTEQIKKRIAELKRLIAQLYEEIDALQEEKGTDVDNYLTPIAGALEENFDLLEKDLNFLFKEPEIAARIEEMQKLKRVPIDSSLATAVGYDAKESVLYVEFANTGKIYAYYEVEQKIFDELLKANSKGSYIRNNLIDCYSYGSINRRNLKW